VRWQIGRLSFAECVCAKKLRDMGAVEERESREGGAGALPIGEKSSAAGVAFRPIAL